MGRGRGTEKKNTGGIIGRGYTISSPLLLRSFLLSLSLSSSNGAPLTKETCSLQAHVHLLRDDALLTILGQDSLSLTFSFNVYVHVYIYMYLFLSLCSSFSVDDTLPRAGCSSGLYFANRGFCGLPGKGQPTPSTYHPSPRLLPGLLAHGVLSRRDASAKGNWEEGSTSWKLELVSIFIRFFVWC